MAAAGRWNPTGAARPGGRDAGRRRAPAAAARRGLPAAVGGVVDAVAQALVDAAYVRVDLVERRGEFAALPAHEANLRLMGADRVLEHLGLRTRLFAAPGWTAARCSGPGRCSAS